MENIQLNLIEDRPPVNITSPGAVPINLTFGRLNVKRDQQGIFHIQPIGKYPWNTRRFSVIEQVNVEYFRM